MKIKKLEIIVPSLEKKIIIDEFVMKRIEHDLFNEALRKIINAILFPEGASMVFVYGPTGVGKTTLLSNIIGRLSSMNNISIDARSPEQSVFGWIDFYKRLLIKIDSTIVGSKPNYNDFNIKRRADGKLHTDRQLSIADLRSAVIDAMFYAQTKVVIIDEFPHLKKGSSGARITDQMDAVKSFTDEARKRLSEIGIAPVFILAGTYDILNMLGVNGQSGRRSIDIHFPRYDLSNDKHVMAFKGVIRTFQLSMKLSQQPDLESMYKHLNVYCLGCVGTLKQILARTYNAAIIEDKSTITLEYIKKHVMSTRDMNKISREINEGENLFQEMNGEYAAIYLNLGIPSAHLPLIDS